MEKCAAVIALWDKTRIYHVHCQCHASNLISFSVNLSLLLCDVINTMKIAFLTSDCLYQVSLCPRLTILITTTILQSSHLVVVCKKCKATAAPTLNAMQCQSAIQVPSKDDHYHPLRNKFPLLIRHKQKHKSTSQPLSPDNFLFTRVH